VADISVLLPIPEVDGETQDRLVFWLQFAANEWVQNDGQVLLVPMPSVDDAMEFTMMHRIANILRANRESEPQEENPDAGDPS
jgi:hypothetical protein